MIGQVFGDRGYISQKLFETLYERGLQLITKAKKNMKQRLMKLTDKILLRKRSPIESVNNPLKNLCQIVRVSVPKASIPVIGVVGTFWSIWQQD